MNNDNYGYNYNNDGDDVIIGRGLWWNLNLIK